MPAISIAVTDLVFNETQAAGNVVSLAGGDLWDDPKFTLLSPVAAHSAIGAGSLFNLSTSQYYNNTRQSGWFVDNSGLLNGFSTGMDGAAHDSLTVTSVHVADTFTLAGVVFTAVAASPLDLQFVVGGSDAITASNIVTAINSTLNASIKGVIQADGADVLGASNVVFLEAVTPGSAGNATALTSSNGARLTVATGTFTGGADGATPTSPSLYIEKEITFPSVPAGSGVQVQFTLSGVDVEALAGAEAFLTFQLGGGAAHQPIFAMVDGQYVSAVFATTDVSTTSANVGFTVENYVGRWQISNVHVFLQMPQTYSAAGEASAVLDLSSAAGAPPGDPAAGLGGALERLLILFGPATGLTSELAKGRAGDTALVDMGNPTTPISTPANNVVIAAQALGIRTFGYIALGRDNNPSGTLPYPQDQLMVMLNRAKFLGLSGIYLDISNNGPPWPSGFGVSRWKQVWIVNQAHALGLKVIFNDSGAVFDNTVNSGAADLDKTTAIDAGTQHTINDGTAVPLGAGDGLLAESWGLSSNGVAEDWGSFQATGALMAVSKANHGVDTFGLFYKLPTTTILNLASEEAFAFYASAVYGLTGYTLYDTIGYNDTNRPLVFLGTVFADAQPVPGTSGNRLTRRTDQGVVAVTQDPTKANTDPLSRGGTVYQSFKSVTVTQLAATESIPANTSITWSYQTSLDGVTWSAPAPLTDSAGTITGFGTPDQPTYLRLQAILETSNPAVSSTITFPIACTVVYSGAGYARVHGFIEPSVEGPAISTATLTFTRQGPVLIGDVAFVPISGSKIVTVDPKTGEWSINLAAAATGTTYAIQVSVGQSSYVATVVLTAGSDTRI